MTLLGEVGDFFLIQCLELVLVDFNLVEERGLLQLDVVDDDLIGAHEFLGVLVVVSLDLLVGDLDRGRVGLERQRGEITGLLFQAGKGVDLVIGDKTAAGKAGAQLADEHFLG
ncbi:hypothetical protein D3C76_1353380 [compost metagenome]